MLKDTVIVCINGVIDNNRILEFCNFYWYKQRGAICRA